MPKMHYFRICIEMKLIELMNTYYLHEFQFIVWQEGIHYQLTVFLP